MGKDYKKEEEENWTFSDIDKLVSDIGGNKGKYSNIDIIYEQNQSNQKGDEEIEELNLEDFDAEI